MEDIIIIIRTSIDILTKISLLFLYIYYMYVYVYAHEHVYVYVYVHAHKIYIIYAFIVLFIPWFCDKIIILQLSKMYIYTIHHYLPIVQKSDRSPSRPYLCKHYSAVSFGFCVNPAKYILLAKPNFSSSIKLSASSFGKNKPLL